MEVIKPLAPWLEDKLQIDDGRRCCRPKGIERSTKWEAVKICMGMNSMP